MLFFLGYAVLSIVHIAIFSLVAADWLLLLLFASIHLSVHDAVQIIFLMVQRLRNGVRFAFERKQSKVDG